MADDAKHEEIVIIRRGGHGEHEEHHGGVWKIAFADFMTAMMAFFLVMWLISANDKTRASVARYFNPVRLVDATTQPRGLHESKKDESGITASPDTNKPADKDGQKKAESGKQAGAENATQKEARLDGALRENPMAALAEIASTGSAGERLGSTLRSSDPVIGRKGGEAFRDPFAPASSAAATPADDQTAEQLLANFEKSEQQPGAKLGAPSKLAEKPTVRNDVPAESEAKELVTALKSDGKEPGPRIDAKHTPEGLLLSMTDTADFAMFGNASAVPARQVVLMMERVGAILKAKPGTIVVRGFTDSKPFRSKRYDNWHLSLDRAQVAHYMLLRGGLDDGRISRVEGYADRARKPGLDPASPLNRRIEILLLEPTR